MIWLKCMPSFSVVSQWQCMQLQVIDMAYLYWGRITRLLRWAQDNWWQFIAFAKILVTFRISSKSCSNVSKQRCVKIKTRSKDVQRGCDVHTDRNSWGFFGNSCTFVDLTWTWSKRLKSSPVRDSNCVCVTAQGQLVKNVHGHHEKMFKTDLTVLTVWLFEDYRWPWFAILACKWEI